MTETRIELKTLKRDMQTKVDAQTVENAIFVENSEYLFTVTQIKLVGKYNRVYNVVTDFIEVEPDCVVVDNDLLIICLAFEVAIVDLKQDKTVRVIDFDDNQLFGIFQFKSGYFIHGEAVNLYWNKNFDILWRESCGARFFNSKVKKDLEVFEDYIVAFDWNGDKHYYNETGEFKREHYPQYSMD